MIETSERKLPVEQIKEGLIQERLAYLVPLSKRELYAGKNPLLIPVSEANKKYYPGFVDDKGIVIADIETPTEDILNINQLYADQLFLDNARAAQLQWIEVAHSVLSTEQGQQLFKSIVSHVDQKKLELFEFVNSKRPLRDSLERFGYLSDGVLVRIDELLSEDHRLLACDPNLIPLGYASIHGFIEQARSVGFDNLGNLDCYLLNLGRLTAENGGRLSGIITALTYPNWTSHLYTAKFVRKLTGMPFFAIPLEAVNPQDGAINSNIVADFYNDLGLEGADAVKKEGDIVASLLVRYCRETPQLHEETRVVNYAGFRVLESQLWGGLITLPGFEQSYNKLTGKNLNPNLHQQVNIPSLIARKNEGCVEIATSIDGSLKLDWVNINKLVDLLTQTQNSIATTDKQADWTWFVKSPSTSGKKGVRFTSGARPEKTEKGILKLVDMMNLSGVFLLQPKVRSTLMLDNEEQRLKVDLFLSGENLGFCGIDAMLASIHQRASHGGSATKFGLVRL